MTTVILWATLSTTLTLTAAATITGYIAYDTWITMKLAETH